MLLHVVFCVLGCVFYWGVILIGSQINIITVYMGYLLLDIHNNQTSGRDTEIHVSWDEPPNGTDYVR